MLALRSDCAQVREGTFTFPLDRTYNDATLELLTLEVATPTRPGVLAYASDGHVEPHMLCLGERTVHLPLYRNDAKVELDAGIMRVRTAEPHGLAAADHATLLCDAPEGHVAVDLSALHIVDDHVFELPKGSVAAGAGVLCTPAQTPDSICAALRRVFPDTAFFYDRGRIRADARVTGLGALWRWRAVQATSREGIGDNPLHLPSKATVVFRCAGTLHRAYVTQGHYTPTGLAAAMQSAMRKFADVYVTCAASDETFTLTLSAKAALVLEFAHPDHTLLVGFTRRTYAGASSYTSAEVAVPLDAVVSAASAVTIDARPIAPVSGSVEYLSNKLAKVHTSVATGVRENDLVKLTEGETTVHALVLKSEGDRLTLFVPRATRGTSVHLSRDVAPLCLSSHAPCWTAVPGFVSGASVTLAMPTLTYVNVRVLRPTIDTPLQQLDAHGSATPLLAKVLLTAPQVRELVKANPVVRTEGRFSELAVRVETPDGESIDTFSMTVHVREGGEKRVTGV